MTDLTTSAGSLPIGLCLAAFCTAGLAGALDAASALGVDVVDLPTDSTMGLVPMVDGCPDGSSVASLRRRLNGGSPRVHCVSNSRDTQLLLGPHGMQTDSVRQGSVESKRWYGLQAALATIRLAAELQAPFARLQLGCPDFSRWLTWSGSPVCWQDNIDHLVEQATPILGVAATLGVTVLLEPHPKQVLYDPLSTRATLEALRPLTGPVRLCLDPANLAATGHDPIGVTRGWGQDLGVVHVKDLETWRGVEDAVGPGWCRYGPGPPIRFRALGQGELPWPRMLRSVLDQGFDGVVYLEHEDATMPRMQATGLAVERIRQILPTGVAEGKTW